MFSFNVCHVSNITQVPAKWKLWSLSSLWYLPFSFKDLSLIFLKWENRCIGYWIHPFIFVFQIKIFCLQIYESSRCKQKNEEGFFRSSITCDRFKGKCDTKRAEIEWRHTTYKLFQKVKYLWSREELRRA